MRNAVKEIKVAARYGEFLVYYVRIPEDHMLFLERQVSTRVLSAEPLSLLVFTNPE